MFLTTGKSKYRLELRTPKRIFCISLFSLFPGFSRIAVKVAHLETRRKKKIFVLLMKQGIILIRKV